jgi:hypothetical protein
MVSGVPLGGRNLFQNEAGVTGFLREISQVTVASLLGSPVFLASFYLGYHSQKIKGIFSFLFFFPFLLRENKMLWSFKATFSKRAVQSAVGSKCMPVKATVIPSLASLCYSRNSCSEGWLRSCLENQLAKDVWANEECHSSTE